MAVTFTPNIGLAKPTDTELALEWARSTKLAEDNNLIIVDKTNVVLTSYTSAVKAHTTDPNLGTGTARGEYQLYQGYVFGHFAIEFLDAGITSGTGEYGFKLPFPVNATYYTVGAALNENIGINSIIGEGYIYDNSDISHCGSAVIDAVTISGVSYGRFITETYAGKTSRLVKDSMPFTLANKDKFTGNFVYKVA